MQLSNELELGLGWGGGGVLGEEKNIYIVIFVLCLNLKLGMF